MTKKIFWQNPYLTELATKVTSVDNALITVAETIFYAFSNERRYWKINEFAAVPCGGTHIKRTGEIGQIKLKRVNPGKGKERIEIYLPD